MTKNVIQIFQIVISILLIIVILLQGRGQGLSSSFGGSGNFYTSKRGIEKILFILTIFLIILFGLSSIFSLIL